MGDIDQQDLKKAELDYCLSKSLDFVDKQALEDVKNGKEVGDDPTTDEEEKIDEWHVDVRYSTRLLKKANEMRTRKRLCDVTIGLADGKLEAHKSLLAAGSPFFKHLTETTRANTLNFYHIPCSVADILFDFIYTGGVSQEKVTKLSRSERHLLREKAELFQIGDQLAFLWEQLGLEPGTSQDGKKELVESSQSQPVVCNSSEIVKRKVLYMNEKRKEGDFSDWKIRISAVDIPVSKIFLAASSTYFADFFARNPMEAKSETYTLTELNRRMFRKVLNFIYTGHVTTKGKDMQELKDMLFQATYLGIGDLSNRLTSEMESRLDIDNCFSMFSYANTINCRQLFKSISQYIGRLGSESSKNSGFLDLAFSDLKAVLLNPELRFDHSPCLLYPTEFEQHVFDLLVAWIQKDHVRRSSCVTELFDLVDQLGSPPYTGRKEAFHSRIPKELNHVMSTYYLKMLHEPSKKTPQLQEQQRTQQREAKHAVRVRPHLLPTRLLASRQYPIACPHGEGDALMPPELQSKAAEESSDGVNSCSQLSPIEWKLASIRIYAADEAFTRLTGLDMLYRRYPLFAEEEAEDVRSVRCGYRGLFEQNLELLATERIVQLSLGKDASDVGIGGCIRACVRSARTCTGRQLGLAGVDNNQSTEVIKSPEGSRGFLHGLGLRFDGIGTVSAGGSLTVLWAVEADVHGLGEAPWCSVIENE